MIQEVFYTKLSGVYLLSGLIENKLHYYIGQSVDVVSRFGAHHNRGLKMEHARMMLLQEINNESERKRQEDRFTKAMIKLELRPWLLNDKRKHFISDLLLENEIAILKNAMISLRDFNLTVEKTAKEK